MNLPEFCTSLSEEQEAGFNNFIDKCMELMKSIALHQNELLQKFVDDGVIVAEDRDCVMTKFHKDKLIYSDGSSNQNAVNMQIYLSWLSSFNTGLLIQLKRDDHTGAGR